ncbi:4-amino-4-deoxy-L-arabinose-phospho-UDP flippase [Rosenbergiella australiborealis]|uniref:4-amino-4-deoxy-L-arabinose-phospho-UDP flippase n=1 Tax=Rosenbergiella australiborealis TaxID=1544696 RepID=UPI001F4D3BF8|nr:4-amino-4-deoxy-L-arabinose-phospho-UDP flippase [Rosenbergiella australiborealis]
MKKYYWIIASIGLVTLAQILLRLAAYRSGITLLSPIWLFSGKIETLYLLLGLGCYFLSVFSWTQALRSLPLSQAYPLLSISYILVWASSFLLPEEQKELSWQSLLGLGLIVAGVYFIVGTKRNNH